MKTFRLGGIHPKDNKLSSGVPIVDFAVTSRVVIPLGQHIGAPAEALVKRGDTVRVGDLIGKAVGFVSANVHSSVYGVVSGVGLVADGGGVGRMAVTIDVLEGDREQELWNESIDRSEVVVERCDMSKEQILKRVADCGIVGMGGATFPTHIKLTPPPGKQAKVLIVNGVECEPFLTSDHRLMLEHAPQVVVGCTIVMRALGVDSCKIGVENNKRDAIRVLQGEIARLGLGAQIAVVPLKMRYPQGGEKQLVAAITSREIPSGALPIEVGAVVQNVSTVYAVYQAVQKNRPLIDRVVTVSGSVGVRPSNLRVRFGTSIEELLGGCAAVDRVVSSKNKAVAVRGGASVANTGGVSRDIKVINGGPMMGRAMSNVDYGVTKGCSGVVVMGASGEAELPGRAGRNDRVNRVRRVVEAPCISCAKCVSACPMGLEPYLLCKISRFGYFDRLEAERVTDCIECGCCSYTCPSNLPLLDYIRLGKAETIKLQRGRRK